MPSSLTIILLLHRNHVSQNSYYSLEIKTAFIRLKIKGTLTLHYPSRKLYALVKRGLRKLTFNYYLAIYTLLKLT
jgi:hypothetical protein